jgi:hypothetical protein
MLLTKHSRHFSCYCSYINITHEAHALIVRLSTGQMQFIIHFYNSELSTSGSTVTTAWCVLGLRIEETAFRYGGEL